MAQVVDLESDYRLPLLFVAISGCRPNEALKLVQKELPDPRLPPTAPLMKACEWTTDEEGYTLAKLDGRQTKINVDYAWRFTEPGSVKVGRALRDQ